MSLKSLVLCSDEKIVRVLRRVLSDLEISIEHCSDPDSAIHKLTRQRFESIIIDCTDVKVATSVLKSARSAPCNKRAVAVAIMDGHNGLRAARALMKRERRRNARVPVQLSVALSNPKTGFQQNAPTTDLSEGGMAVQLGQRQKDSGPWQTRFKLPGSENVIEVIGESAWHNPGGQVGIRFVDLQVDAAHELRQWLNQHSPEGEKDDPPVRCRLTDLSLGGCYLEIASPFPSGTRIVLSMRVGDLELHVCGIVRVMHPEVGMGVELAQTTREQRNQVERFIQSLMNAGGTLPELLVEPEGLESVRPEAPAQPADLEDPLLELFQRKAALPAELFLSELRKQRSTHRSESSEESILPA